MTMVGKDEIRKENTVFTIVHVTTPDFQNAINPPMRGVYPRPEINVYISVDCE